MARMILFSSLLLICGCVLYERKVEGLLPEIIYSQDIFFTKGIVGRYYAHIEYCDELTMDVMAFGLQERFAKNSNGWLTLVFRKKDGSKTLWNSYVFDSSKPQTDIGELKLANSVPLNSQGGLFDLTELLNSTPKGVLFITYDFVADERYKPFGKLHFDGLMFGENPVFALEINIKNQELPEKVSLFLFVGGLRGGVPIYPEGTTRIYPKETVQ